MTPDRILDLTVKFGVVPFMFYVLFLTRSDLESTREDVKQVQELLTDCYTDQIEDLRPRQLSKSNVDTPTIETCAILPDKQRLICYD